MKIVDFLLRANFENSTVLYAVSIDEGGVLEYDMFHLYLGNLGKAFAKSSQMEVIFCVSQSDFVT